MSAILLTIVAFAADSPRHVDLCVTDAETGKPIANATIRLFNGVRPTPYAFTDAAGKATVDDALGDFTLDVHSSDHIQQRVSFDDLKSRSDHLELKLRKGERTIGGVVVNEDGRPVAGATVRFSAYLAKPQRPALGIQELVCDIDAVTDAHGRWSLKCVDQGVYGLHMLVRHPDYAYISYVYPPPGGHELLAGTAKWVLKRGIPVAGKVRDEHGNPIAGATVVAMNGRKIGAEFEPTVRSGPDGAFRIPLEPGRNSLTVQAPGCSPAFRAIEVERPLEIAFTLMPGRTVRGRVLDPQGAPIAGATLQARFDQVRAGSGLNLLTNADANGVFELRDAPADTFHLSAFRSGYLSASAAVPAHGNEAEFVLKPGVPALELALKSGKIKSPTPKQGVGPQVAGVVKGPDGQPTAGALVLWAGKATGGSAWFTSGGIINESFAVSRATDDQGRFTVPRNEPYALAVSHESGWALWQPTSDRNLGEEPDLTLMPWATIKGTFLLDGKPAANVELRYNMNRTYNEKDRRTSLAFEATATTDAAGRFVMTRVPARPGRLVRYMKLPNNSQTSALIAAVSPATGETLEFPEARILGRTVVGRLKLPEWMKGTNADGLPGFTCMPLDAQALSDRPYMRVPKELEGKPRQQQVDWWAKWSATPEGKKDRLSYQHLRAKLSPDGSFRVEGAKAGPMVLQFTLRESALDASVRGDVIAIVTKHFVVAEMPDGYCDEPLDLGAVAVDVAKAPKRGQKAPTILATGLDGKEFKILPDDGNVRLLDFWASWCGPCVESMPQIAELHEELGAKGLEIISLSVDDDLADAAAFVKKEKCSWRQAHLGPKSPATQALGVEGYPTFIVVDRDGSIRYRGSILYDASRATRAALAE